MQFNSDTTSDGIRERLFILGDIPGLLWTPPAAPAAAAISGTVPPG